MFTRDQIGFVPARKPYRIIGLLLVISARFRNRAKLRSVSCPIDVHTILTRNSIQYSVNRALEDTFSYTTT